MRSRIYANIAAALAAASTAFANESTSRFDPQQMSRQESRHASPGVRSATYGHRPCWFGPFTMHIDETEAAEIAEAAPSGREALDSILALEEDFELPPFTFFVATEDDGGDDISCR